MWWTLGSVKVARRVRIEIQLDGGGELQPDDVALVGQVLQWIGDACRKWRRAGGYEGAEDEGAE